MKDKIERATGAVVHVTRTVATLTLVAAVLLNFANIVGRYVFSAPIEWAEEGMLFLMVGIVFLDMAPVSLEGGHIRMDVIVNMLPPPARRLAEATAALLEVAVAGVVIWFGVPVIQKLAMFNQLSQAARIPVYIPQALVPIGFGLAALATLARLISGHASASAIETEAAKSQDLLVEDRRT
jgi:C4-dicarboxylate transporter, DctQ subunit